MAMDVARGPGAAGMANGASPSPTPEEQEKLYERLLQVRDVVLAGKHPQFKLPPSAVEQLKASLIVPPTPVNNGPNGIAANGHAFTTNTQQHAQTTSSPFGALGKLPGLQNGFSSAPNGHPPPTTANTKKGPISLDPIFLQKSEHLVREETRLKRQRLERDLEAQLREHQKNPPPDKDPKSDPLPRFNVDALLQTALDRVKHVSGLKMAAETAPGSAASSSFDENDYYSSLVQSAFNDDFERLDGSASRPERKAVSGAPPANFSRDGMGIRPSGNDDIYGMDDDDDDEYSPPDAAELDPSHGHAGDVSMQQATPEDDDSDYEPGEITAADSTHPSPRYQQHMPPPANVPVIRNHLTHIAAPQPNRVSPLTTNKDSNIELELVNGRPEVVHKPSYQGQHMSRVSSASPTAQSGAGTRKNKKQKKRKRDNEPQGRNKRRQQRQSDVETPRSPVISEPYIKPEPTSPQPFMANLPPAPQHGYAQPPAQVDLTGSRPMPPPQYAYEQRPSYQYGPPEPRHVIQVSSPAPRPVQRDTQDLRRVASLHHAHRPNSPRREPYSPVAAYRAAPAYGDPRLQAQDPRPRSPAAVPRYDDAYSSRAASPALMPPPPPPAQPQRRIVQDQYGNRYYAADSGPSQPSTIRASAVPESYERAPSRAAFTQPPPPTQYYERQDDRMPPPPQPATNGVQEPFEYTDADGYIVRGYRMRPADRAQPSQQPRYSEAPTSPSYQEYNSFEQMPPPPVPQHHYQPRQNPEPTSPTYDPNASRSYSVHPDQHAPQPPTYLRQASVAPVQYVPLRQGSVAPTQYAPPPPAFPAAPPPQRAMSVAPGYGYAGAQHQPMQPQAPPRFVDQYGNPVYSREVREVRQGEDYYRQ